MRVNPLEVDKEAALELIAIELKAQGTYLARTLSFHGASFDTITVPLSDEQVMS